MFQIVAIFGRLCFTR